MIKFTEDVVEQAALLWLQDIGYTYAAGPDISRDGEIPERATYQDVILIGRLRDALHRLNPQLPSSAIEEATRQITIHQTPNQERENHRLHQLLVNGVTVEYQAKDGRIVYAQAQVIDFAQPAQNDWLAVNQFSIRRTDQPNIDSSSLEGTYRPDIILFVNGLPFTVIELKNTADEKATVHSAYIQLQNYKNGIPNLFFTNAALIVSDGMDSRMGTITADWEWFKAWRAIDADPNDELLVLDTGENQLETLIRGALAPERFLDLLRYFIVYEDDGQALVKKMAGYHQYFAVNKALQATLRAVQDEDDGRVGVVWHTQGSGKSLSMLFYAGKIIQDPALQNPTLVVLTDRNDLDDQLFNTFTTGHELLRQRPEQAESIEDLRDRLNVASGHVIFTTIQKFAPPKGETLNEPVSKRKNIVFIVDEAHRSQYGFETQYKTVDDEVREVIGLAQHMRDALPNAAFIGFTGTPISHTDRNTQNVFGKYIDIYDLQRAVEDKATVPIYYESRYSKLKLDESMQPKIDPEFEEITEGQEELFIDKTKSKWARIAAVAGTDERIAIIANDIVTHYEQRNTAQPGKAMIVGMSRPICVKLYNAIIDLRPAWAGEPDSNGTIPDHEGRLKIVMSGSASDDVDLQPHIRSKRRRRELAKRFRKADSGFDLVIVRDMWLTGFDAPSLHTMYVDKPMKGHGLMQAIARVNRVYPEKQGGLVVSYLPLELQLQEALKDYTEESKKQVNYQDEAAAEMNRYYDIVRGMFHGFDYQPFIQTENPAERLKHLTKAVGHILKGRDANRNRFINQTTALGRAYALANPHPDAVTIRNEVAFFQVVKATLVKSQITTYQTNGRKTPQAVEAAIEDIVNRAVAPDGVIDLLEVVEIDKQAIELLSDDFLIEVKALEDKDLAAELLRRLIEDRIKARHKSNLVKSRHFSDMLSDAVKRYNDQVISAKEIIETYIDIAQEIRDSDKKMEELGLSAEEVAFYEALSVNQSAVDVLGNDLLKELAQLLVKQVRGNVSIDWELREAARAEMRVLVKRILRRYGYPPDKQKMAVDLIVQQATEFSKDWAVE